jgi:hypothetical protein
MSNWGAVSIVLTETFLLVSNPALAADPGYIGVWALTAKQCMPYPSGVKSEEAFRISAKRVKGGEWLCDIRKSTPDGAGWTVRLSCGSEGSGYSRTARWVTLPNGRLRETEKGKSREYVRCKDGNAN